MNFSQMLLSMPVVHVTKSLARKLVKPLTKEQLLKEAETGNRVCTTCGESNPLSEYYVRTGYPDKRVRICNQCDIKKVVNSRRKAKYNHEEI